MGKIKAVLFDFDGTLVDTNEIILGSWRHTYKTILGRECTNEEVVGTFGEILYDTMVNRFPDVDPEEAIAIYRQYQEGIYKEAIEMCPGMRDLVLELKKRGYKTAIVTSRLKSSTETGLYKFDIADQFDAFVSCEDTDKHKPDPTPCLIALEKLGVTADEAIMIGDSKYDIQCAHNAGIKAVLVNWTICLPEEQRVGLNVADWVVDRADEILDIIQCLA